MASSLFRWVNKLLRKIRNVKLENLTFSWTNVLLIHLTLKLSDVGT